MSNIFRLINWRAVYIERCTYGSEGGTMKPRMGTFQGAGFLPYDPSQSSEDMVVTQRLVECGELMGIMVLDHIIIGDGRFVSLQEKGLM